MEFYIRRGATDPILKLKLVDDGRTDKTGFSESLETAMISFDMYDIKTNNPIILNGVCFLSKRTEKENHELQEYCINYQFTEEGTSEQGRFEGIVTIIFLDTDMLKKSKLIVPIKEKLFINVI
jgi:hypothetical protein